jgi:15-cis-phytoene synthase
MLTQNPPIIDAHLRNWERTLLLLAHEGLAGAVYPLPTRVEDPALLARAYDFCDSLTAHHSRTFYLATRFLPPSKRKAVRALYAFCRISDDLVDCPQDGGDAAWDAWRQQALSAATPGWDLVAVAWADARLRYRIPLRYAEQLLDGIGRDRCQTRYRTFDELAAYAYSVASTVGLMSMHIIGFAGKEAISYAVKLGVALQISNILRDVGEDWRAGRVYLPQEELAAFGLDDSDLGRGCLDHRWRDFMRFQIRRNRLLYAEAVPGIRLLHRDGRFAVAAAADLYGAILTDIEAHGYDVFQRRAHLSAAEKLLRLPAILFRSTYA